MLRARIRKLINKIKPKVDSEPTLSLYIPISPNPQFYSRVKWIRKSLDYLGPPYSKAIIHLTIGNENEISIDHMPDEFPEFKSFRQRYRFHLANREKFEKYAWLETGATRFLVLDDSDIIIHCDADVLFVKRFDDLLNKVTSSKGIYGVIAHNSPFSFPEINETNWWKFLSAKYCGKEIDLKYNHSLQVSVACPPYYNNGFVIGDNQSWQTIKSFFYQNFSEVYDLLAPDKELNQSPGFFSLQISLALALFKFNITTHPLSEVFNFANDDVLCEKYASLLSDVRVIHYLRQKYFDRDHIFIDRTQIDRFLTVQNLDPISKTMQKHVGHIIRDQGYD
ncbi:MAG: hypothetical protein IPL46_28310 [Saprospiraceae bacterium]|nr:hypothetical protein [Saprospiraceae bacterium]